MKKKLFLAMGIAALAVSCTNDELQNIQQEAAMNASEGITFTWGVNSRGEFNYDGTGFATGWNAEADRIGVIFSGAAAPYADTPIEADAGLWNGVADADRGATPVLSPVDLTGNIYKATKTGNVGLFTSVDDDNMLQFAEEEEDPDDQVKASFRIFRPAYTTGTNKRVVQYTNTGEGVETMLANIPAFNEQNQPTLKANFDNFFMVSEPINDVYSSSNAVGESLALAFERPFAALAIKTSGYNKDIYGKLKSVAVAGTSTLAYSTSISVDIAKKAEVEGSEDGIWTINTTSGTPVTIVKLNINGGTGLEWSDDAYAFIQIMPVDRSEMEVAEKYTITFEFEKGDVVINKSTTNNWEPNGFVRITADLANEAYTYLASGNTLIVNTAMPTVDASGNFKYGNSDVAKTNVKTVLSNKVLTADELKELKKFTAITNMTLANQAADLGEGMANIDGCKTTLVSLTLTEALSTPIISDETWTALTTLSCPKATSIPESAFAGNVKIASVNVPVVETIGNNAFEGATQISTIGCLATDKLIIGTTNAETGVKTSALTTIGDNAFVGTTLTSIDAPELATIGFKAFGAAQSVMTKVLLPKYNFSDIYNTLALLGGDALVTLDLSNVAEIGGTSVVALDHKPALTTVTLKEGVTLSKSAFQACSLLATVTNLDKAGSIGESALAGTKLATVKVNVAEIGKNAFAGCTTLTTLYLGGNVTTIGEGAFSGCTSLATVHNSANITSIGKEAFKGTEFPAFDFYNATLGEGAFQNSGLKAQVTSNVTVLEKNVFNGANTVSSFKFAEATTVKEGALVSLGSGVTITFGSALTSIDAKAFCTPDAATTEKDGSTAEKAITGTAVGEVNLILNDKTGLTIDNTSKKLTYKAADGKYYVITFNSIQ